jgi:hypothetical protein
LSHKGQTTLLKEQVDAHKYRRMAWHWRSRNKIKKKILGRSVFPNPRLGIGVTKPFIVTFKEDTSQLSEDWN